MSRIGDAVLEAEETYGEEFHRAMDEWEFDKASQLVFKTVVEDGKKKLVNVK